MHLADVFFLFPRKCTW